MAQIVEKIIEPSKIFTSSIFKLKIKVKVPKFNYYNDYLTKKYIDISNLTYEQVREEK